MVKVITAYIDNLIAWGDALFRQETGESVDEAAQLYGLAAEILDPRPQQACGREWGAHTDVTLRPQLDAMTSALAETELDIPFDALPDSSDAVDEVPLENLRTLGEMLDFWAPGNDTLLGYWETVADRLFKARNSRNI